ncbi:MAG: EF-hand domain-containing protein [Pirellulaceae bacterium]
METIYRDYAPRGVKFYYVYKALAHPETNGYVTPYTLEERLMHVKEAERRLGSQFRWICDTMSNDMKHTMGDAPNSEFVIDPEGKVVRRRAWSNPDQLRKDLETLIGPVDSPTLVKDLNLETIPPPRIAPKGVVPRVKVPGRMRALKIEPQATLAPCYAKLRAEADEPFFKSGKGTLYLGFHMDPIYHVHWNNLADPLTYEVTVPPGATVTPSAGEAPKVEPEADSDPREFLLEVEKGEASEPLEVTVRYFACNDEEGWCKPVTQQYTIHWEADPDGGTTSQRSRKPRAKGEKPLAKSRPPHSRPGPQKMLARIKSYDANEDGKISREEAAGRVKQMFDRMDTNADGFIDEAEREAMVQRMRARKRPPQTPPRRRPPPR